MPSPTEPSTELDGLIPSKGIGAVLLQTTLHPMNSLIILLLVVGAGLSAYEKARHEGTWSWPLFAKTMIGALVLVAMLVGFVVWLGSRLGPDHALAVVLLDLVMTALGVTLLAFWVRPKPGSRK